MGGKQLNTLLIPDKIDVERESVANSWIAGGGSLMRIGKFWVKPDITPDNATIYGNDTFSLVLAQLLGISLATPNDEFIAEISNIWTKRDVEIITIKDLEGLEFPKFIKSVKPKLFQASVIRSFQEINSKVEGLESNEQLIVSDEITIKKEIRAFILQDQIKDLAYYEGSGTLTTARDFIEEFLKSDTFDLPVTYVLDIGFNDKDGWFIIEFNASWGAGLNGCDPNLVTECILAASE